MRDCFVAAIVAGWAIATAGWSPAQAEEKPTVVCESDASGRALSCRDAWPGEDAAPFRRIAPAAVAPTGAAPQPAQPLLAAPAPRSAQATAAPDYLRSQRQLAEQPAAPLSTKAATASVVPETRNTTPEAVPTTAAGPETGREPVAARSQPVATPPAEPVSAPHGEPASPALPAGNPTTAPAREQAAAPAPEVLTSTAIAPSITPAVEASPEPQPDSGAIAADLLGNAEFAALAGNRYTLELANASTAAPLRALAARLQLDGAVYLVHLRNPEGDRWLLAWSDHASQAEARAARLLVPADAVINSGWPRRLGPLQNELASP